MSRVSRDLFRNLISGSVVGVVSVAYCISYAVMIFSGPLIVGQAPALSATLAGAAIVCLLVGLFSGIRLGIGGPDTPTMAVIATLAAGLSVTLANGPLASEAPRLTLFVVIAATFVTGLALLAAGWLRLGTATRFVPYPVVAGFLSASGVLLCGGGVRVAAGDSLRLDGLAQWLGDAGPQLLTAAAVTVALFLGRGYLRSVFTTPIVLGIGVASVHLYLGGTGISMDTARDARWFLTAPEFLPLPWLPWLPGEWPEVDTSVLLTTLGDCGALIVVSVLAIVLQASGLEVIRKSNINLNRELSINGVANVVAAIGGGFLGSITLNRTVLNVEAGATRRLSAVLAAAICAVPIFAGINLAAYVPTPVLGGLLVYLGLSLFLGTVFAPHARMAWYDYGLIAAIVALIIYRGYLEGAILGVAASCLIFAFSYSRARVIKHSLTRQQYRSAVERAATQSRLLHDHGDRILILWLQGYIFFGTANRIFRYAEQRITAPSKHPLQWVVLDFELVVGMDASAALSFIKLRNLAEKMGVKVAVSGLSEAVGAPILGKNGKTSPARFQNFPTLDEALEWCEDDLLGTAAAGMDDAAVFRRWLARGLGNEGLVDRMIDYLDQCEFAAGDVLMRRGDPPDEIFLVCSGRVSVYLVRDGKTDVRLRSVIGQTLFGEMGFYREAPRSASVIADVPTTAFRLTRSKLSEIARDDPELCAAFQALIIRVLSDRVNFATDEIDALMR